MKKLLIILALLSIAATVFPTAQYDTAVYKQAYKSSGIVRTIRAGSIVIGDGCVTTMGMERGQTWLEGVFLMAKDGYILVRDQDKIYVAGVCTENPKFPIILTKIKRR